MNRATGRGGKTKLRDEAEFRRWWDEGREYKWIVQQYKQKYNEDTTPSMFSNWRAKLGLQARAARRNLSLIPWNVQDRHDFRREMKYLRLEARVRAGLDIGSRDAVLLKSWVDTLKRHNIVVHYEPDTEEGFFYVARRMGVDTDLIRVPTD